MPEQVRAIVGAWRDQYRKNFISVETVEGFYADEDSKVTMINLLTDATQSAQAAGDFAGHTKLSPCAKIPLAEGVVAVVTGFFLGHPYCYVYQFSQPQLKG